jgi:polyisoprenoid-binding protein YceI
VALFGCGGASSTKPNPGKPAATGGGAINPENTKITFVGTKENGEKKHDGGFKAFSGTLTPIPGDVTASTISVEIDTDSLYSDNPKLTGHLKSPDFFEVKKHPKASFVSTAIKAEKKGDNTHVITGKLTLHGTEKEISFPAKVALTDELVTLDSTFPIDRTQFGITYGPGKVDNEVKITVSAKVPRK